MSAMYLSCEEWSMCGPCAGTQPNISRGYPLSHTHTPTHTHCQGHPHVLGLDAGLLGTDVAIILITFMVPLTLLQLPKG